MSRIDWFLILGSVLAVLGSLRLLLSADVVRRIVALNIAGAGVFVILVALAARTDPPDPVLHALVLTGIVIAVSMTGLALVLKRHADDPAESRPAEDDE
ncbi:NADH-quinone oxidoreductase subunit K [Mycobacterium sp. smrl_JER01]|uniref:NADH-quinone oxidoreductase subunit K n=1 Tax=Mycobacterium sp. smrl_JER01 TaxID=3402633 RepID=UPI003AD376C5